MDFVLEWPYPQNMKAPRSMLQRTSEIKVSIPPEGFSEKSRGRQNLRKFAAAGITILLIGFAGSVVLWNRNVLRLSSEPPFDPGPGTWRRLSPSPLSGREFYEQGAFWSGREALIWGGLIGGYSGSSSGLTKRGMDGAAFDPMTDGWRLLPPTPLESRWAYSAVWTGTELIVWGGQGDHADFSDGAAYDPERDRWRLIAPSPLGPRWGHASVWTGREMLIVGGVFGSHIRPGPGGYRLDGAAYDPATDSWRPISQPPPHLEHTWIDRFDDVWTGEALIVTGYELGLTYHRESDTWRELPPLDLPYRARARTVWAGSKMLLVASLTSLDPPGAFAYHPGENKWQELGPVGSMSLWPEIIVWTGIEVLVGFPISHSGEDADLELRFLGYDPAGQMSRELQSSPLRPANRPAYVWTGSDLIVWGGDDLARGASADGAAFTPGY